MKTAVNRMENLLLSIRPSASLEYQKHYSFPSLVLIFFTFPVLDGCGKSSLHLVMDGMFINRGVLTGPWLPIYGTAAVMMLVLLKRLAQRPGILFGCTVQSAA